MPHTWCSVPEFRSEDPHTRPMPQSRARTNITRVRVKIFSKRLITTRMDIREATEFPWRSPAEGHGHNTPVIVLSTEDMLRQSLTILVFRRQYALAIVSVLVTSVSVLVGMTLNNILHTCLGGIFSREGGEDCRGAALQSGGALVVSAALIVALIRTLTCSFQPSSGPDAPAGDRVRPPEFQL